LNWEIGSNRLVDRIGLGGNSTLWGAAINLDINTKYFNRLKGFETKSMNVVPGIKSNKNLGIMVDKDSKLFSTTNFFSDHKNIINGYVINFKINDSLFHINYFDGSSYRKIVSKKIYLCLSVPQTIALLVGSKIVQDKTIFTLSEHVMNYRGHDSTTYPDKDCVVSYKGFLAFARALGLRTVYSNIFNLGPYVVDQIFTNSVHKMSFQYDSEKALIESMDPSSFFGKSIHYFGMKINEVDFNSYLNAISPNLMAFGHSTISGVAPGPIANDILIDVINKLN
jgi:hypothetical protein